MTVFHLARRAITSFRNYPPLPEEVTAVRGILLPAEFALWSRMQNRDQRHSLDVLRRFDSLYNSATRDERAAALLHDVGKCESQLGWLGRIIATTLGPCTDSFRTYLDHEQIGLALISNVSRTRTSEVLKGDVVDDCVRALRDADNI